MNVVRTVLGDIDADELGVCYAHEHLIIDGGIAEMINPEISLPSVGDAVSELAACTAAGVRTLVDAMPADAGRNVVKLAEVSRRASVNVIVATGLHHARYYGRRHWSELLDPVEIADIFVRDIEIGVDALDSNGPIEHRTEHRAGIVKVASSTDGPSSRDLRTFEAAAMAVARTGVPLMTHCEQGRGGVEQLAALDKLGVPLDRVVLSHTDKVADRGYHRELLGSGANVVYDQGLRDADQTAQIVAWAADDDHLDQVVLGTDSARRSLWTTLGGSPGLAALRTDLGAVLESRLGAEATRRLWVANPARVLTMSTPM